MIKQNQTPHAKLITIYICLAIAVCVITVVTLAVVGSTLKLSEISIPDVSIDLRDTDKSQDEQSSIRTGDDTSGVDAMVQDPPEAMCYPVIGGEIIKPYSMDALVLSQTMNDWRTHSGADISASLGDKVFCIADGTVADVRYDDMYGYCVTVQHKDYQSVYMNLAPEYGAGITNGAKVASGAVVGYVGQSAVCESADAAHLHLEIIKNGSNVNPSEILDLIP